MISYGGQGQLMWVVATACFRVMLRGGFSRGYYGVELLVGERREKQMVLVDTGSWHFVLGCGGGHRKGFLYPDFEPRESGSFRKIRKSDKLDGVPCGRYEQGRFAGSKSPHCHFLTEYVDGTSFSGTLAKEVFVLQGADKGVVTRQVFGCATVKRGVVTAGHNNGVLGLRPRPRRESVTPTFTEQILRSRRVVVAVCLAKVDGWMEMTTSVERLESKYSLGSAVVLESGSDATRDFSCFFVAGVKVEGEAVGQAFFADAGSAKETFFDSGTTHVVMPVSLYRAVRAKFDRFCRRRAENCAGAPGYAEDFNVPYTMPFEEAYATFPTLSIVVEGGQELTFRPADYLAVNHFTEGKMKGQQAWKLYPLFAGSEEQSFILGAPFMYNKAVVLDHWGGRVLVYSADCRKHGPADSLKYV